MYLACCNGDSVDATTYEALHTTIDLDGLYDLIEMRDVHASWMSAGQANAELSAEQQRARDEARRGRR